jgi:hypothetical protein
VNIFNELSSGDYKLNEPAITGFLRYIIDPEGDHGLKNLFLSDIYDIIFPKANNDRIQHYEIEIKIEAKLRKNDYRKDTDILILFRSNDGELKNVICIENKIRDSSVSSNQMSDQYNHLNSELKNDKDDEYNIKDIKKIKIGMILISLRENPKVEKELNKLELISDNHYKKFIPWLGKNGIIRMFQNYLFKEGIGKIPSINKDFIFILKNFIEFALNEFTSQAEIEEIVGGKYQRQLIYNFDDYLSQIKSTIDHEIYTDLIKLHKYIMDEHKVSFRISERDRRITYAIQEPFSSKTIFLQIKIKKKGKIILLLRKSEYQKIPTHDSFEIEDYNYYIFKVYIKSLNQDFKFLKDLISKSHDLIEEKSNGD